MLSFPRLVCYNVDGDSCSVAVFYADNSPLVTEFCKKGGVHMRSFPRLVVFSDLHGVLNPARSMIEQQKDQTDTFVFLGDGLRELDVLRREYPALTFHGVRGNCDREDSSHPLINAILFAGKQIVFTHGHGYQVKYGVETLVRQAKNMDADVALYGHTHVRYRNFVEDMLVFNPGSLSMPRDGRAGYGVLDFVGDKIVPHFVDSALWGVRR